MVINITTEPNIETDCPLCPHCGAESTDDDLCRFCGKVMVATVATKGECARALHSGIRAIKGQLRPMTPEQIERTFISADYGNPANAIWDK